MQSYLVQPGDSLSKIAALKLGNASRWPEIAGLNSIKNPNLIFVGQLLQLPATAPQISQAAALHPIGLAGSAPPSADTGTGARLALARGSLFVVFEQLPEMAGKVIRKVAVIPRDFSLVPDQPLASISPAEHALNLNAGSQFLSASDKVFGAPSIGGTPLLIDIAKLKAAGARIVTVEELLADLKRFSAENPAAQTAVNKLTDVVANIEGEILIEGPVEGSAVSTLSTAHSAYVKSAEDLWKQFTSKQITRPELQSELVTLERAYSKARIVGRVGRTLTVVGVIFTVKDVAEATQQSFDRHSFKPLEAETIRQVGGWGGAIVGGKIGFGIGALFGIETGPGAVLTGAAGAVIFGGAGYFGADWVADKISPN